MPTFIWVILGIAALVTIWVKISWDDNFLSFGLGATVGLALLLILMITNLVATGCIQEKANELNSWEVVLEEELIPVSMRNFTRKNFCIDCIPGRVDWCNSCGEAYELPAEGTQPTGLCEDCWYDMYYNY